MNQDGRYTAFATAASNLVPNDTNDRQDVFVYDALLRKVVRVSISDAGGQGNADSGVNQLAISADGRFVAFTSHATNLDGGGVAGVFLHDRDFDGDGIFDEMGAIRTIRVSVATNGQLANEGSYWPSLSADGRFVTFASNARNLDPSDTDQYTDIYLRDRDADLDGIYDEPGAVSTKLVSVSTSGTKGNNDSTTASISADGRIVAFQSEASNLIPGDTASISEIFIRDRDVDGDSIFDEPGAVATTRATLVSDGAEPNGMSYQPAVSGNGRFVAFFSEASNLAPDDTNGAYDIFVHDRLTASTVLASRSTEATIGNHNSYSPSFSDDGRFLIFHSSADNLAPGPTLGNDGYVRDRDADADGVFDEPEASITFRATVRAAGIQADASTGSCAISRDGTAAAVRSRAYNLTPGLTGGLFQIFSFSLFPDPPVAGPDPFPLNEDQPLTVPAPGVLGNDTEPVGDTLSAQLLTPPTHGELAFRSDGSFDYAPDADFYGEDSFTYRATSVVGASAPATVTLSVSPVNDAPVSQDDTLQTPEDTPLTLGAPGILANDFDTEADPLTAAVVTPPASGLLTLDPSGQLSYTPPADFVGTTTFTYRANDGQVDGNTAQVSITVTPVNDAPVADTLSVQSNEDTPVPLTLSGQDVDGDPLSFTLESFPAQGVLTGTPPNLTYTPPADFTGEVSFTFQAHDAELSSQPATVLISLLPVNDAPLAVPQMFSTPEDTPQPITLTGEDVDGDTLTYVIVQAPSHGALTGEPPHLVYTPAANYHGADSFAYVALDGQAASAPAQVQLTISPQNDPPVAADFLIPTPEDTAAGVELRASDVDGDLLTYAILTQPTHGVLAGTGSVWVYTPAGDFSGEDSFTFRAQDPLGASDVGTIRLLVSPANDPPAAQRLTVSTLEDVSVSIQLAGADPEGDALTYSLASNPLHGTLSGTPPQLTYTPVADYSGPDSFQYRVGDGTTTSPPATVSIAVFPVNDPPVALADAHSVQEDGSLTVTAPGVLADDVDTDSSVLFAALVTGPQHGTLTLAPDGGFTYTPTPDYSGPDGFSYRASDGNRVSQPVAVTLAVTPLNDPPVAAGQSLTLDEDTSAQVKLAGSDVDGDALTYRIVTAPAHGQLQGQAPNVTYHPGSNFHGADSFSFTVSDGAEESDPATVTLTVSSVNDAPTGQPDLFHTAQGTPLDISSPGVLANDSDVDGDTLSAQLLAGPAHGDVILGADGELFYAPEIGFSGVEEITYRVTDGTASSDPISVFVTVASEPPPPTAGRIKGSGTVLVEGNRVTFSVSAGLNRKGQLIGKLTVQDRTNRRSIRSMKLTSLVIDGNHARLFGTAQINRGPELQFVADLQDGGQPRGAGDLFGLEVQTSTGVPTSPIKSGNITVRP